MQTHQQLTDPQKEKRLASAKILLNKMKSSIDMSKVIFSDEKLLTVEVTINQKYDRVLAKFSEDILNSKRRVFGQQKPPSVMVWAAISKTKNPPLIFVPQNAKANINLYNETILTPTILAAKSTSKKSKSFTIIHIQKDTKVMPRPFSWFLEQGGLAASITSPQPN